jgi:hypothetical protein
MGQDDPGAPMRRGIRDNVVQRKVRAGFIARMAGEVKAAGLVVHMRDPQALASGIGVGDAACEKGASGGETIQFQGEFGTLIAHAQASMRRGRRRPLEPNPKRRHFGPIAGAWSRAAVRLG